MLSHEGNGWSLPGIVAAPPMLPGFPHSGQALVDGNVVNQQASTADTATVNPSEPTQQPEDPSSVNLNDGDDEEEPEDDNGTPDEELNVTQPNV